MSPQKLTTLAVAGMTCTSCVHHVTQALRSLHGVGSVDVRVKEGKVHVQHDPSSAPLAAMVDVLREAGYESESTAAV